MLVPPFSRATYPFDECDMLSKSRNPDRTWSIIPQSGIRPDPVVRLAIACHAPNPFEKEAEASRAYEIVEKAVLAARFTAFSEFALGVDCPRCSAPLGAACKDEDMGFSIKPHTERVHYARFMLRKHFGPDATVEEHLGTRQVFPRGQAGDTTAFSPGLPTSSSS